MRLIPGMALKILRDNMPSANLVAMYSLTGNPYNNWNFFAKDFKNHLAPTYTTEGVALQVLFSHASDHVWQVGLSDWALEKSDGSLKHSDNFPFQLRFETHSDIQNLIDSELGNSSDKYMAYVDQLTGIPPDVTLYNIYAFDKPI